MENKTTYYFVFYVNNDSYPYTSLVTTLATKKMGLEFNSMHRNQIFSLATGKNKLNKGFKT